MSGKGALLRWLGHRWLWDVVNEEPIDVTAIHDGILCFFKTTTASVEDFDGLEEGILVSGGW